MADKPIINQIARMGPNAFDVFVAWSALGEFDPALLGTSRKFGKALRVPKNLDELSEMLNVPKSELEVWKKSAGFEAMVQQDIHRMLGDEIKKGIRMQLHNVSTKATMGSVEAMKLWWNLAEKFVPGVFAESDPEILKQQAMAQIAKDPVKQLADMLNRK